MLTRKQMLARLAWFECENITKEDVDFEEFVEMKFYPAKGLHDFTDDELRQELENWVTLVFGDLPEDDQPDWTQIDEEYASWGNEPEAKTPARDHVLEVMQKNDDFVIVRHLEGRDEPFVVSYSCRVRFKDFDVIAVKDPENRVTLLTSREDGLTTDGVRCNLRWEGKKNA